MLSRECKPIKVIGRGGAKINSFITPTKKKNKTELS